MNLRPAAAVALSAALALGGCADNDQHTQLKAPELVTTDNLDGASVEVSSNRPLVIPVEDDHPERWTQGSVEDESVARFVPGKDSGPSDSNPGFEAVGKGTTSATLTDPDSGEVYTFTITSK